MESTVIANLAYFNITNGSFKSFIERLELYFLVNKIVDDEKQKSLLLTTVDEGSFVLIQDLIYPKLLKDKTYQELVDVIWQKVNQRTSVWKYRLEFYNAKQEVNESITDWITRVRQLAVDCKVVYELDLLVINRFIAGIRDKDVLERLYEESYEEVTLDRAIEIAKSIESSHN